MTSLQIIDNGVSNLEGEVAVLSAMICHPALIDSLADRLDEEDFSEPLFGQIYGLVVREHSAGRSANPVTLRTHLEGSEAYATMGGFAWLAALSEHSISGFAAQGAAEQVRDLALRRRLIEGLRESIASAADFSQPMGEVIEAADAALLAARGDKADRNEFSGAECLDAVINGFDAPVTGTLCGNILSVDQLIGPMRPSHLVIGAGRPGMGKTATAISYALGSASRGHGVLFYSLEMSAVELGERMAGDLCLDHLIPYAAIRDRTLSVEQRRHVFRARDYLAKLPLQIIDKAGMSIAQLRASSRRWKRRFEARGHKLELIIVDYLQLMRAEKGMDRYAAVTEISRSLKEIAKDLGVAVFALAQLSRAVESRADKRPQLADLRESGQIEQDADAVLFFLRHEYYLRLAEPDQNSEGRAAWERMLTDCQGRIEFICAKRRNGATGSLTGEFLYHYQAVRG
jgi:replicative DNA helicase